MKCLKLIIFIALTSFGFASCSMGGGHTRCAAYANNDASVKFSDDIEELDSKEYKEV